MHTLLLTLLLLQKNAFKVLLDGICSTSFGKLCGKYPVDFSYNCWRQICVSREIKLYSMFYRTFSWGSFSEDLWLIASVLVFICYLFSKLLPNNYFKFNFQTFKPCSAIILHVTCSSGSVIDSRKNCWVQKKFLFQVLTWSYVFQKHFGANH